MLPYICIGKCGKVLFAKAEKWYNQKPERVLESESHSVLWDFDVQWHQTINAKRPDVVILNKAKKEATIVDVANPGDARVAEKEVEKLEKYQLPKDKIIKMGGGGGEEKVFIVPVAIGVVGIVSKNFESHWGKLCRFACKTWERGVGDLCQLLVDTSLNFSPDRLTPLSLRLQDLSKGGRAPNEPTAIMQPALAVG